MQGTDCSVQNSRPTEIFILMKIYNYYRELLKGAVLCAELWDLSGNKPVQAF